MRGENSIARQHCASTPFDLFVMERLGTFVDSLRGGMGAVSCCTLSPLGGLDGIPFFLRFRNFFVRWLVVF